MDRPAKLVQHSRRATQIFCARLQGGEGIAMDNEPARRLVILECVAAAIELESVQFDSSGELSIYVEGGYKDGDK